MHTLQRAKITRDDGRNKSDDDTFGGRVNFELALRYGKEAVYSEMRHSRPYGTYSIESRFGSDNEMRSFVSQARSSRTFAQANPSVHPIRGRQMDVSEHWLVIETSDRGGVVSEPANQVGYRCILA